MDQQWNDNEQAKADMAAEHAAKMGPEEPGPKETAKQWAFGGPNNESWSGTAKRWGKAAIKFHDEQMNKANKE